MAMAELTSSTLELLLLPTNEFTLFNGLNIVHFVVVLNFVVAAGVETVDTLLDSFSLLVSLLGGKSVFGFLPFLPFFDGGGSGALSSPSYI